MTRRAWLLDASIYIFRAWFSLPDRWKDQDGNPLNAVYGYASFLCDLLPRVHPASHLAAAFDESLGSCFRNELYPDYKSSRALPDEALAFQLRSCRELTERCGIPCYGGDRYEADDYLASLARLAGEQQLPVTVISRDKDLGQLLTGPANRWWDFAADKTVDSAAFEQRFGVRPQQFADYLGLVGDSVDDIPGVPGVGPRTAAVLISELGSLEAIAADMAAVAALPLRGASRLGDKLSTYWSQALLSRELARLDANVPEVQQLPDYQLTLSDIDNAIDFIRSLGLDGPLVRRWQALPTQLQLA
ncbi:flap endonuclease [Seongchinamella sediminis]|uniref:Flap endonuclease n=1 Tax=Seongchinamella sediminis TaxID=2283635 RepID=A0A3L7DTV7_9GAMM|nr:5'-3' exonuclease H3TH domain-containing protein [Seongchinamella sediminis]RLQ20205.1 flap endonuclease [Seongchinamella sediminis]